MTLDRRSLLTSALALSLPLPALSQRLPREGVNYKTMTNPQPNSSNTKVDVIEFFWYGCPGCYAFQPMLIEWEKIMPPDTNYIRVPAAFDPARDIHSRIYYTLEALNLVEKYHQRIYYAIHKERNLMFSESSIADYMAKAGVDKAAWLKAFNSKPVKDKAVNARKLIDVYRIEGTPEMAVGGRYRTSNEINDRNPAITLATVNYLIALVRKSQGRG